MPKAPSDGAAVLWAFVKDGKEICALMRPVSRLGRQSEVEFLSTVDGKVYFSRLFREERQLLKMAGKMRADLQAHGWRARERGKSVAA